MSRPRLAVGLAVAVGLLGLLWWRAPWEPRAPLSSQEATSAASSSTTSTSQRPDPSAAPPRRQETAQPPRHTETAAPLPARAALLRPSPPAQPEPARRRIVIAEQSGKLRDRRGNAGQDAPTELELIHAGLDTIQEDIEACLEQWAGADAEAEGKVLIGFQLDETGLTGSWVAEGEALPFGVKTCFASAVYGVDWSHIVKHPAEITNNYELSRPKPSGPEAVR